MSLMDWLNMNLAVDISLLIFAVAVVWKFRKVQKELSDIKSDLTLTMRNPAAAKRLLKERK